MQVKVDIDPDCKEPIVIIKTNQMTDEITELIEQLHITQQNIIAGFHNDTVELLDVEKVIRFYSLNKKVYAQTDTKKFIVRLRLYELEERLSHQSFVRISHSEIINLKAIQKMDLSYTGTIAVILSNQVTTYVSRRYVSKIKKVLGI
ncbi:LytTR family DNA-binding domain-containing protein [Candidatus Stoquefichus massiliensis]|uniref:LytTR family DNA-binding domain-containing protein n=1 Tax=Candidatus Stoquefichus massiliensis TaxID=1470350 RepID=UPI00047FD4EC|nr:LytTR family DNA-binding domain-containing protein [Candidatus Stoquefichus massiliensis]